MRKVRQRHLTAEEAARLQEIRERYQREKPTPDQMMDAGETFMPLGSLLELRAAMRRLKEEREEQGITLAELAEITGIDAAALSRLENGRNENPTYETVTRVAAALGLVIEWRFRDIKSQTPAEE